MLGLGRKNIYIYIVSAATPIIHPVCLEKTSISPSPSLTVLIDSSPQSSQLLIEGILTRAGPQSQEERSLGRDGGRDGKGGIIRSIRLNGGEEASRREARSTREILHFVEFGFKVLLRFHAIGANSAAIEATDDVLSEAEPCETSQKESTLLHN